MASNDGIDGAPLVWAASPVVLPPPHRLGGMPLMEAFAARRSTREFSAKALPLEILSDLLWAGYGINRPKTGERTAPYWRHVMVIDVYVAMAEGVWIYDPQGHRLLPYLRGDIRRSTGFQDFVGTVPVNLIYVAHGGRMTELSAEDRRLFASVDAAFVGQNVYLYCCAEGLATVFRGALDGMHLGDVLQLGEDEFVTFAQSVGFPASRAA